MPALAEEELSTFGEMAQADPQEQIPLILHAQFDLLLSKMDMSRLFFTLLFGTTDFRAQIFTLAQQAESMKSICAKTLTSGDVAWKCEDCEMDPTCIICMECFEKSDHKGHRVKLQRGAAGCCDCGDTTAWKEEGFCTDHKGYPEYTDEEVRQLLPDGIYARAKALFKSLGEYMHKKLLEAEALETNGEQLIKIGNCLACVQQCLDMSPLFIQLFTTVFSSIHPHIDSTKHECVVEYCIDEAHKAHIEEANNSDAQSMNEDSSHPCTCPLLALIWKLNNETIDELMCDVVIFKMFQSLRFKTLVGFTYIACYGDMLDGAKSDNKYLHLGVQILTIPEIALAIFKNQNLRSKLWECFTKYSNVWKDSEDNMRSAFFFMINDFKYLMKEEPIKYCLQTGMANDFISLLSARTMKDAIVPIQTHIFFASDGYFVNSLDYQYLLMKATIRVMNCIDYTDTEYNQNLAVDFVQKLNTEGDKFNENLTSGYLEITLYRLFSTWLARYLMTNLILKEVNSDQGEFKDFREYKEAFREVVAQLFDKVEVEEMEKAVMNLARVSSRALGFIDEIKAQKWVKYGLEIGILPKVYSESLTFFFRDPDFLALQTALMLTKTPQDTFRSFLEGYCCDGEINTAFTELIDAGDEASLTFGEELGKQTANAKLLLFLINSLMTDDRTALYCFNNKSELWYPYDDELSIKRDQYFDQACKYEAIHALVKFSGSTFKKIMDETPKQLKNNKTFEEYLNQYARITKNREGMSIFSLDPKYVSFYNSFYFTSMTDHIEAVKSYDEFFKPKMKKADKEKVPKNSPMTLKNAPMPFYLSLCQQSLIQTDIGAVMLHLLQRRKSYEFIDNDIEEYCAHNLTIMVNYLLQNPEFEATKFRTQLEAARSLMNEFKADQVFQDLTGAYFKLFKQEDGDQEMVDEGNKKKEESKKSKKEMAMMRKKKALAKMNKKRSVIVQKCGLESENSSSIDTASAMSGTEEELPKCQQCYESLSTTEFDQKPYGFLACVIQTKLFDDSCQQTFNNQKNMHASLYYKESDRSLKDMVYDENYSQKATFTQNKCGVVIKTCRHMMHYDCLNLHKQQAFEARAKLLLSDDMDINNFSCPLCKQYANTLIPPAKELEAIDIDYFRTLDKSDPSKQMTSMYLDLLNMVYEKTESPDNFKSIFFKDLPKVYFITVNKSVEYVNHVIQLTDVKGLSWTLNEKPKLRSVLHIGKSLANYTEAKSKKLMRKMITLISLEDLNISDLTCHLILMLYFSKSFKNESLTFEEVSNCLKLGYSILLMQIAARIVYEQELFYITDKTKVFQKEVLMEIIEKMDAKLVVSGQPVETSQRFIEGSLSYMRKATAILYLLSEKEQEHHQEIKKLKNSMFAQEPGQELSMLINILNWDIQDVDGNINFYKVMQEVQDMKEQTQVGLKDLYDYVQNGFGLEAVSEAKDVEMEDEEEKVDTSSKKHSKEIKKADKNWISTSLYMITPDYCFTLPKLPKTLEQFTKEYYKENCSLCNKISKRGAICLICKQYMCVARCDLSKEKKDFVVGNLSKHSKICGPNTSVFIGPHEGQLIYIFCGLAVDAKSPFIDKYGECYDEKDKRYETYNLSEERYNQVRKQFLDFEIPNFVVSKRANKTKVYIQNVL